MKKDLGSIAKTTLADRIAKQIAQMVRGGDYEPGDRLPTISDMSDHFGVGHPTLREALKKLETLGVVQVKHGSGVYIQSSEDTLLVSNPLLFGDVSKDILIDLIEARISIETQSAHRAAQTASPEHIDQMVDLLKTAEDNLSDDQVLTDTNMSFHRQIAVASGNAVICQILDVLSSLFEHEQRTILDIYGHRQKDHDEHRAILDAIRAQNPSLAEERMESHLEGVLEIIQQWDPKQSPLSDE
jgi:GntR family transcriptional repressor for pyruvate dehydrogenase complex